MKYYVRFGELPENGISAIYRGEELIGHEKGVSVYDAIYNHSGKVSVAIPLPITRTTLDTFIQFIRYDNRPAYLCTGKYLGRGQDNEPIITDVKIIRKIEYLRH